MKNFKNMANTTIALILSAGLMMSSSIDIVYGERLNDVKINEKEENDDKEGLLNYEIASAEELRAYDHEKSIEKELHFGEKYESLLELFMTLKELAKIDNIDEIINLDDYYMILNDSRKSSEDIKNIREELLKEELDNNIESNEALSDAEIKELKDQTLNYIYKGTLFENDKKDNITIEDLTLFYNSIIDSRDYYEKDGDLKKTYDEKLKTILDYIDNYEDEDINEVYNDLKLFISDDESLKASTISDEDIALKEDEEDLKDIQNEIKKDSLIISNNNHLSSNEKIEYDSPFYTNEATKNAYIALSDSQRKELDLMDINKDGILSDEEINNSNNYQAPIPTDMWLYPFTEEISTNPKAEEDKKEENKEDTNSDTPKDTTDSTKEAKNTETPKTVTLSDKENKSVTTTTKKEEENKKTQTPAVKTTEKPKVNTVTKENVKTGVDSLGIVVAILVVAIIGFLLIKNRERKNKK